MLPTFTLNELWLSVKYRMLCIRIPKCSSNHDLFNLWCCIKLGKLSSRSLLSIPPHPHPKYMNNILKISKRTNFERKILYWGEKQRQITKRDEFIRKIYGDSRLWSIIDTESIVRYTIQKYHNYLCTKLKHIDCYKTYIQPLSNIIQQLVLILSAFYTNKKL